MMLSVSSCLGIALAFVTINPTRSYVQIPYHLYGSRSTLSTQALQVLPPWSELATVAAQISIVTPALIQMYYFRKKIDELGDKYEKLEQSTLNTTQIVQDDSLAVGFSNDMRQALAAYQELYGSMSAQIDTILTNEEKRAVFESDLVSSITGLQVLSSDVTELRKENTLLRNNFESTSQSIRASTDNIKKQQIEQGKFFVSTIFLRS